MDLWFGADSVHTSKDSEIAWTFTSDILLKWQQKTTPGILVKKTHQKKTLPDTFKTSFYTTNIGHHQGKSQPLFMEVRVHSDSDAVESDQRSPHLNAENSIRSCVSDEVSNASNGESNWAFCFCVCVFYLLWVEMLFCCFCSERYGDVLTGSIVWIISLRWKKMSMF